VKYVVGVLVVTEHAGIWNAHVVARMHTFVLSILRVIWTCCRQLSIVCAQNILIQMGLRVVSVDGMLIRRTHSKILHCYGCGKYVLSILCL